MYLEYTHFKVTVANPVIGTRFYFCINFIFVINNPFDVSLNFSRI